MTVGAGSDDESEDGVAWTDPRTWREGELATAAMREMAENRGGAPASWTLGVDRLGETTVLGDETSVTSGPEPAPLPKRALDLRED